MRNPAGHIWSRSRRNPCTLKARGGRSKLFPRREWIRRYASIVCFDLVFFVFYLSFFSAMIAPDVALSLVVHPCSRILYVCSRYILVRILLQHITFLLNLNDHAVYFGEFVCNLPSEERTPRRVDNHDSCVHTPWSSVSSSEARETVVEKKNMKYAFLTNTWYLPSYVRRMYTAVCCDARAYVHTYVTISI